MIPLSSTLPRAAKLGLRLALALALVADAHQVAGQTPVTLDGPMQSGMVMVSPVSGIGFTIPEGFSGGWDPETGGIVLQSNDALFVGLWGWSEGTVEEAAFEVQARLENLGVSLAVEGEPDTTGDQLTGLFEAYTGEATGLLGAAIRRGPGGNVIAIAVLGSSEADAIVVNARDALVESLQFGTPEAATWHAQVEGAVFTWSSSGSDMSGGSTTATGASSSVATLSLCGGSMYRYAESSESYVSIEGVSASNESSDGHAGAWAIFADLAGQAILELETSDGRAFYWFVEQDANGYLIDGYRYQLTGRC